MLKCSRGWGSSRIGLPRSEEAMDLDPYRAFRSLFESKTVRSAWAKSYGEQFWEASEPPQIAGHCRRYQICYATLASKC